MSPDPDPADGAEDQPCQTRRAVDELIHRSGARPVASIEDLESFRAGLWDSEDELQAFLSDVRASRAPDA